MSFQSDARVLRSWWTSFTVYEDSSRFYCFGCGAGGDVLDFVQRTEGLTLPEAIRRLDGGALVTSKRSRTAVTTAASKPAPVPERDPALLGSAMHFYIRAMLRSPQAREYLASRGIGFDAAARLGLGYAPGHGSTFGPPDTTATGYVRRGSSRRRASGSRAWWSFPTPYRVRGRL